MPPQAPRSPRPQSASTLPPGKQNRAQRTLLAAKTYNSLRHSRQGAPWKRTPRLGRRTFPSGRPRDSLVLKNHRRGPHQLPPSHLVLGGSPTHSPPRSQSVGVPVQPRGRLSVHRRRDSGVRASAQGGSGPGPDRAATETRRRRPGGYAAAESTAVVQATATAEHSGHEGFVRVAVEGPLPVLQNGFEVGDAGAVLDGILRGWGHRRRCGRPAARRARQAVRPEGR